MSHIPRHSIGKTCFPLLLAVVIVSFAVGMTNVCAKLELHGKYTEPKINRSLFGDDLSMVNSERDEYATNLAAYAVKIVQESSGDQKALDTARKVLGLALHLSPRNKKSIVVNAQLKRGIMPEKVNADYNPEVFARLLLTRGKLLEKRESEMNTLLARFMFALSSMIDPRNEEAIYIAEIRRIDSGDVPWTTLTDGQPITKVSDQNDSLKDFKRGTTPVPKNPNNHSVSSGSTTDTTSDP